MASFGERSETAGQDVQYQAFRAAGGSLTEEDYQTTIGMIKLLTKTPSVENVWITTAKKTTVSQFDNESRICHQLGITTSPAQKALYCFLRRREEGNRPRASGLTDQEIVADILLMTETAANYHKYVDRHPAISQRQFLKRKINDV